MLRLNPNTVRYHVICTIFFELTVVYRSVVVATYNSNRRINLQRDRKAVRASAVRRR